MAYESNKASLSALSREVNELKAQCLNTFNINENNRIPEMRSISSDNINEKVFCYIEGLSTNIKNTETGVIADENMLTGRFLSELKHKTKQMEDLIAFTKGSIEDTDKEIERTKSYIKIAHELKTRTEQTKQQLQPEHLERARNKFRLMKSELQTLIRSLFPECADEMTEFIKELMIAKNNPESSGYIPITGENYELISLLKDMDLVSVNPYSALEVKLVD